MKTKMIFDKTTEIFKDIAKIKGSSVTVGIHEKAQNYSDGTDIVMVAAVNEFGSVKAGVPERSYMRTAFDENIEEAHHMMDVGIGDIILGSSSVKQVLGKVGFFAKEKTKTKMESIKEPANADSTAKGKNFNNPLIATRHLKNSIASEVHTV